MEKWIHTLANKAYVVINAIAQVGKSIVATQHIAYFWQPTQLHKAGRFVVVGMCSNETPTTRLLYEKLAGTPTAGASWDTSVTIGILYDMIRIAAEKLKLKQPKYQIVDLTNHTNTGKVDAINKAIDIWRTYNVPTAIVCTAHTDMLKALNKSFKDKGMQKGDTGFVLDEAHSYFHPHFNQTQSLQSQELLDLLDKYSAGAAFMSAAPADLPFVLPASLNPTFINGKPSYYHFGPDRLRAFTEGNFSVNNDYTLQTHYGRDSKQEYDQARIKADRAAAAAKKGIQTKEEVQTEEDAQTKEDVQAMVHKHGVWHEGLKKMMDHCVSVKGTFFERASMYRTAKVNIEFLLQSVFLRYGDQQLSDADTTDFALALLTLALALLNC